MNMIDSENFQICYFYFEFLNFVKKKFFLGIFFNFTTYFKIFFFLILPALKSNIIFGKAKYLIPLD